MISAWRSTFLICCLVSGANAQTVVPGGLQGNRELVRTPDAARNRALEGVPAAEIPELGLRAKGPVITMVPNTPPRWTWLGCFNVPLGGRRANAFMNDGWLYTTVGLKTTWRLMRYQRDLTGRVSSNALHMAFYRSRGPEREIVLFIVSPRSQVVTVIIPADIAGRERRFEFTMEENTSRFLRVSLLPDEYTTVTWEKEPSPRLTVDLCEGWKFQKGEVAGAELPTYADSGWADVTIPHTWNAKDVFDTRNRKDEVDLFTMYYRGSGWYRKRFVADMAVVGRSCQLEFLGANQAAEVWLNGALLGKHQGGYTGFAVDAGPALRPGKENVVAVRVNNAYDATMLPLTADFNFYGGLYREVRLQVRSPIHIRGSVVTTPEASRSEARVHFRAEVAGTGADSISVTSSIVNPYGELAATISPETLPSERSGVLIADWQATLRHPLLWSPDHPYLYQVLTEVRDREGRLLDQEITPFGIRWYAFDCDLGFALNGEWMKLRGVNIHQDFLLRGNAVPLLQKRDDLLLVKKMGANFVRLAHYPHHPYVLHLCDSLGLLVWEEIPLVNGTGGEEFSRNALTMLDEMIVRDRNHPSVILWGVGNEFSMGFLPEEAARGRKVLIRALNDRARSLDPTRLTVQAHNDIADSSLFRITDVQGRNRYYGWYEGTIADFARTLDEEKKRFPRWKTLISEYGAEAKYGYHVATPQEFDHSETYQMEFHEKYWKAIEERPWVAGGTIWNMFDFGSHVKLGNIPGINQKGMMTADRKPKSVYYFYQSRWSQEPMVYIVSHSWSYREGRPGEKHRIRVYSNCDSVSLYHNGIPVGTQRGPSPFEWQFPLGEGHHDMEAIGMKRGVVVRDASSFEYTDLHP
jgi:beta-galactosidase